MIDFGFANTKISLRICDLLLGMFLLVQHYVAQLFHLRQQLQPSKFSLQSMKL